MALEFQQRRLTVIADQRGNFHSVKAILQKHRAEIKSEIDRLQLAERHSAIDVGKLLSGITDSFEPFLLELEQLEKKQSDVSDDDDVQRAIDALFSGKVGACPPNQEWLDAIYKEGKSRYALKQPPGYSDTTTKKEDDVYLHRSLVFRRLYGDLILWKQIIEQVKVDDRFKFVILITDDRKEDWWWIIESSGKKTMGPRPELVEEITEQGGAKGFLMYKPERFLEYAKSVLGFSLKNDTITQVRDISEARPVSNSRTIKTGNRYENAVLKYLIDTFGEEEIIGDEFFDLCFLNGPFSRAFDIINLTRETTAGQHRRIDQAIRKSTFYSDRYTEINNFLIVSGVEEAESIERHIVRILPNVPASVQLVIAFVVRRDGRDGIEIHKSYEGVLVEKVE